MSSKYFIPGFLFLLVAISSKAQQSPSDSLRLAKTLNELSVICKSIDFKDPKAIKLGAFYKAAPYIVYHGDDAKRAWKDFANYKNDAEKKGVDDICLRINGTVNRDSSYKIVQYIIEKEPEGTWHVLMISYKKHNAEKKAGFAFLKIGDRFALGDID